MRFGILALFTVTAMMGVFAPSAWAVEETVPEVAEGTLEEAAKEPAVPAAPVMEQVEIPKGNYQTFAIGETVDQVRGCLWRIPGTTRDGMEMHAALTMVIDHKAKESELLLQMAGGYANNGIVMPMKIMAGRLVSGTEFDTDKIALSVEKEEALRVVLPVEQATVLAKSLAQQGGVLSFEMNSQYEGHKDYSYTLPRPTEAEVALWLGCLVGLQDPAAPVTP